MKNIKQSLKISLMTLSLLSFNSFADFFYSNQSGQVEGMAQTYQNDKGSKIVLVDMIHVAPKTFYQSVSQYLNNITDASSVILEEGVATCGAAGEKYYTYSPLSNFEKLFALEKEYNDKNISKADLIVALKEAGFITETCEAPKRRGLGILDAIKRKFSLYGLVALVSGLKAQQNYKRLYPRKTKLAHGDVHIAGLDNPIDQIMLSSLSGCLLTTTPEPICSEFNSYLEKNNLSEKITEKYILSFRNDILISKSLKAIELGYKQVVLPWGSDHMQDLILKLSSIGFKRIESESKGIYFSNCEKAQKNVLLKELFASSAQEKDDKLVKLSEIKTYVEANPELLGEEILKQVTGEIDRMLKVGNTYQTIVNGCGL